MRERTGEEWERVFRENPLLYRPDVVDERFFEKFIKSRYIRIMVRFAQIKGGEEILEAGCGSGKFSVCLAILGCKVTALDFSRQMLGNTRILSEIAASYFGKLNLRTIRQDLNTLDISSDTFDVTFNEGVVEHWLDKKQRIHIISEMVRVTKKGGAVIIFVPNGRHLLYYWWKLTRYPGYVGSPEMFCYDAVELREEMKAAGLTSIETDGIDPFLSLSQWPTNCFFSHVTTAFGKVISLPRRIREKFGVNIVALGRK